MGLLISSNILHYNYLYLPKSFPLKLPPPINTILLGLESEDERLNVDLKDLFILPPFDELRT